MKAVFSILGFLCFINIADAQRACNSDEYTKQLLQVNPSLQDIFSQVEKQISRSRSAGASNIAGRGVSDNELISIPVVIHIIYKSPVQNISDAQVQSQLDALNKDFAWQNDDNKNTPVAFKDKASDTKIKFCLARVDPSGMETTGIIRKYTSEDYFLANDAMKSTAKGGDDPWDNTKYLNIWVCKMTSRVLGYATPPGSPANLDGLVIAYDAFGTIGTVRAPFNKGRTATHELGHWLGLKHLWGDADCGDDRVDDTPKQKTYNFGSPAFPHVTTCSPNATGDMFMNFMDYTDDACMNMFTTGQRQRMRALFSEGNIRNSFLSSFACDSSLAKVLPPVRTTAVSTGTAQVTAGVFKIYPNPVQSVMHVENNTATPLMIKTMNVFNVTGLLVFTGRISRSKIDFNLSNLAPGVYIIRIGEGTGEFITKFMKQ